MRKHRTLMTSSAAVVLAAVVLLGGATALLTDAYEQERTAKVEEQRQRAAASRAADEERTAKQTALSAAQAEKTARHNADKAAATARIASEKERQQLYVTGINLAMQAWERGQAGTARTLLQELLPKAGQPDLRGFEWHYLWRLCQRSVPHQLKAHGGQVSSIAFAPDGKTMATGSWDGTVVLWDVASRRPIRTLAPNPSDQ